MVGRTTEQYMQAGVAALHLEDQVVNKRCGHLKNKEIVEEEVYLTRIRAAVNARAQSSGDIVIIARTDALQSYGYDAAFSRLKKAIEIGADVAFLEGITSKEEAKRICEELAPTPVLLNMVEGGLTPHFTVAEAKASGFKIIIYPGFALRPAAMVIAAAAKELKETGDLTKSNSSAGALSGPRDLFMACGLKEAMDFDIAAGGSMYWKGV
jgi:2-methylisocitrate lyase-like PEP mutase family enzyme